METRTNQELWESHDHHWESVRSKLAGFFECAQFDSFSKCGQEHIYRTCKACGTVVAREYHCDLKWCPRCQRRIVIGRVKLLRCWARHIRGGKHLVLTEANKQHLTRTTLREHVHHLRQIRRTDSFKPVRGGCVTTEVTNEGRGWHLHSHWLLDSGWLDPGAIARAWGRLVEQDYAIVKVKDAREKDYAAEVCKYVCKPAHIAAWPAEEILEFVTAIKGRRLFRAFGSLAKHAATIRARLNQAKPQAICPCGCDQFTWETELSSLLHELRQRP